MINKTGTLGVRGFSNIVSINNDVCMSEISQACRNEMIAVHKNHDVPKIETNYRNVSYANKVSEW